MMLFIVLTGEDRLEAYEFRLLLLARNDGDDDRRNEVRMLWGEKRAVIAWNLDVCILAQVSLSSLFVFCSFVVFENKAKNERTAGCRRRRNGQINRYRRVDKSVVC